MHSESGRYVSEALSSEKNNLTRRELLKTSIAAGFAMFLSACREKFARSKEEKEEAEDPLPEIEIYSEPKRKVELEKRRTNSRGVYDSGELEGNNLRDLYSDYIGVNGKVEKVVMVDFQDRLEKLWKKKHQKNKSTPVAIKTGGSLVNEYKKFEPVKMNIKEYLAETKKAFSEVITGINWNLIYSQIGKEKISKERIALVKNIFSQMDERYLVAYALTEMMPSDSGRLNVKVLDFLLKNAGREYVESIPAIYDKYTSFGPYQFTQYALYSKGGEKRGASRTNQALPKSKQISGSVSALRGNDHHKAAALFVLDNLLELVRLLNEQQLETLKKNYKMNMISMLQYAATAHHLPAKARTNAKEWLNDGAKRGYSAYCNKHLGLYAKKTLNNFEILSKIKK